jgi:Ca2+-binding RTX toxin-like protein
MVTISEYFQQAQLSRAAYALGLYAGMRQEDYIAALVDKGMSTKQAEEFSAAYDVVTQSPETGVFGTGFSATVFKNKASGKFSIAVRGSELAADDWIAAGLGDIGADGIAIDQGIALYNWLQRIVGAPGTQVVQYAYLPKETDEITGEVTPPRLVAMTTQATGELFGQTAPMAVAGHSLGGHLAMILSRLAPDLVNSVFTYNAPGFDSSLGVDPLTSEGFFSLLQTTQTPTPPVTGQIGSSWNSGIMNHLDVEGDAVHVIGTTPGEQQGVFSESANPISAHLIDPITDALAIYDIFARLDTVLNEATFALAEITEILKATANEPAKSLEGALDAFRKLVLGSTPDLTSLTDRDQFYRNYFALIGNASFAALAGNAVVRTLVGESQSSLQALATATGIDALAYRYALKELNPFAILGVPDVYQQHNQSGTLQPYVDDTSTPAGMTTSYIEDRAKFLHWKNLANVADLGFYADADPDSVNWLYVDRPQGFKLTVNSATQAPDDPPRVAMFGGEGTDVLQGGSVDDRLYGGLRTDLLQGDAGDDYLEGGAGFDVYQYNGADGANDGFDEIRDTDGRGIIRYTYTETGVFSDTLKSGVAGGSGIRTSATQWQSPDGKFTYDQQGSTALLVTINGDAGGSLIIREFDFAEAQTNGLLGIRLVDAPGLPVPARVIEGDLEPLDVDPYTPDTQTDVDEFGNLLVTTNAAPDRADTLFGSDGQNGSDPNDSIFAGGGDDIVNSWSGDDIVQGGPGRDTIDAGIGNDLVEAGANASEAGDIVQGDDGADRLYADARFDAAGTVAAELAAALTAGESQTASGLKGDFLSAGSGDDVVIGGKDDDVLTGGGGNDILVGGAGADYFFGDSDGWASTLDWTVTRSMTGLYPVPAQEAGFQDFATFSGIASFYDDALAGADTIYGGAGNDFVSAGAGDDFVDAGTGDDFVVGAQGDDVLLGGPGRDILDGDYATIPVNEGGDDYLDGGADRDWLYGRGGDDTLFGGEGDDYIEGNEGNDILIGGPGNDVLKGGPGKDTYVLDRGDGFDVVFDTSDTANVAEASVVVFASEITRGLVKFRPGSLIIDAGEGDGLHIEGFNPDDPSSTPVLSTIQFADGDFMTFDDVLAQGFDIDGTSADDEIYGTAVTDRILAGDGNDYVEAKAGDDTIDGGSGDDEVHAGEGNDTVTAGDGVDYVDGEDGDDIIDGGLGDDTLFGRDGVDTISGGDGNDLIYGGSGGDVLDGGDGDDTVDGGAGDDTLTGGAGSDTYVLYGGMGADTATDGQGGETNVLQLGAGVSLETLATNQVDDDLVVSLRGLHDSITISGYYAQSQDWVVRDSAGVETDLETVINLPDPYGNDFIARLWADTRLGGIAQVMGKAYAIGWTALDGDTFQSFFEGAYLGVSSETTDYTYTRVDPPNDILAQTTTEDTSTSVLSYTGFDSPTFHWLLDSFEPGYLESDDAFFQAPLAQPPQTQSSSQALLTLKTDRQLGELNNQSSSFVGPTEEVPYDTGNGTVDALVTSIVTQESYNEFANVTKVDPDASYWQGDVDQVYGNRVLANVSILEDHYLSVRELRGGPSDNYIFASSAGLLFPVVTLIDGGAGDDTLVGDGGLLYGNTGDDQLSGADAILIGGDGDDTITGQGGSTFVYTATETGIDAISESTVATESYLDWYYAGLGIEDWQESADHGGQYRAELGNGDGDSEFDYFDSLEEAQQAGNNVTFVEPLPQSAPLIRRSDSASLEALESAGVLKRDVVSFGPGVTLGDLAISFEIDTPAPSGELASHGEGLLSVSWNDGDAGFNVEVPDVNYGFSGTDLVLDGWDDYELGAGIEAFEFADGSTYTLDEVLQMAALSGYFVGTEGDDLLEGGPGDDYLDALGGNDTLVGHEGDDYLVGGEGSDTYTFSPGDGYDTIADGGSTADTDTLRLTGGIAPEDVAGSRDADNLYIYISTSDEEITLQNWFNDPNARIERVEFGDGTVWTAAQLEEFGAYPGVTLIGTEDDDYLYGSPGNDIVLGLGGNDYIVAFEGNDYIDGGTGNDGMQGGEGDDIYVFGSGYGSDWVDETAWNGASGFDSVHFTPDVLPANVSVSQDYGLQLSLNGGADVLELGGWFEDPGGAVEQFVFDDGTIWDAGTVEALLPAPAAPTSGDDILFGRLGDDLVQGLEGDDEMYGFAGNDTMVGGPGKDYVNGGRGDDTYEFSLGGGADEFQDPEGSDTIALGAGISPADVLVARDAYSLYLYIGSAGDRTAITNWFDDTANQIEQVHFADGTIWDVAELEGRIGPAPATEFDDVLTGTSGDDRINALGGDDEIYGLAGNDILEGGTGDDSIDGGSGSNAIFGGDGSDFLYHSDPAVQFYAGGPGDDYSLATDDGGIVAFNAGDGADQVYVNLGQNFTLSLGGVSPADIALTRSGSDVVIEVGGSDTVDVGAYGWASFIWPYGTLQIIDGDVRAYDLNAVVQAFLDAEAQNPGLTDWSATDALAANLLSTSATEALGGAIAYEYATTGGVAGLTSAQLWSVLGQSEFGFTPQPIVASGNSAPTVDNPIADQSTNEDAARAFTVPADTFSDPDADELTYAATLDDGSALPAWLAFDAQTQTFSGTPLQADVGAIELKVSATDGGGLSAADTFTLTVANVNDAPVVSATDSDLLLNDSTLASTLFSVFDEDGQTPTQYEFWDDVAGGGHFALNGVEQGAAAAIPVSAADLANTEYVADSTPGTERVWVRAYDGEAWSAWKSWTMTSALHIPDAAPEATPTAATQTVLLDESVAASSLFSVLDADGDPVTGYEFWDSTAGNGHFAVNGVEQGVNVAIAVQAADLANTEFVGASDAGSDQVWVRATDGQSFGAWKSWTTNSWPHAVNSAPVADAPDSAVLRNQAVAAQSLFSVSDADGDTIASYEFWDDTPGGGYFAVGGVEQTNNPIPVAAAQLGDVEYMGGADPGTEQVWVRANDGLEWGAWEPWSMTTALHIPNAAPEAAPTAAAQVVLLGQAVDAATLFSVSDADGDAIAEVQFFDSTAGNGFFTVNGVEQAVNANIVVAAADLADTQFMGGDEAGSDQVWVRASDGQSYGAWTSWTMNSWPHATNSAAVADGASVTILTDEVVSASTLFSVSDADGDAAAKYEFWDDVAGGGYWRVNGVQQASGAAIPVDAADLANTEYVGGANPGSEQVWVRANDGLEWGAWKNWTMTTALHIPNAAPEVSASTSTVLLDQAVDAGTLFSATDADGDTITQYELWDSTAGNGHFTVDGVEQGVNVAIGVTAAQLADTQFVASSDTGSDTVWARAYDGMAWSSWQSWTMNSWPHETNTAPVVTAANAGLLRNEAMSASMFFGVSDADGDAATAYEYWDDVNGGGYWALDGVQQASGQAIPVAAADLANLDYVGGANSGTEQVWARASDGMGWSPWKNWLMATEGGMLRGGDGPDTLNGEAGPTVLEGGAGNDVLTDTDGNNLFSGGEGDDTMTGGDGNDLFAGGAGNDTINTGAGSNVIAYNAGGGTDTVYATAGAQNTLSFGGGIGYDDLALSKNGNDLIVSAGANDLVVLKDWYAGSNSVLDLQVILDATSEFDANSSDPLYSKKVQTFDFAGLVSEFDAALAQSPGLTSWSVTNALLAFHLSGADDAAIGGDLAYWYGKNNGFTGISLQAAQQAIGAPGFGADAQTLHPFNGLQEGYVKLA